MESVSLRSTLGIVLEGSVVTIIIPDGPGVGNAHNADTLSFQKK